MKAFIVRLVELQGKFKPQPLLAVKSRAFISKEWDSVTCHGDGGGLLKLRTLRPEILKGLSRLR